MQLKIFVINYVFSVLPKFRTNFFTSPTFIPYLFAKFFFNNLGTCHEELQVFLELIDNYCAIHVIHVDIQDQLREYILLDDFRRLNLY